MSVAEQVGYQDYSTFSRAYKKQFGHGPSADVGRQHDLPKIGKKCDYIDKNANIMETS